MPEMTSGWNQQKVITASEEETLQLARSFGEALEGPWVVLLYGELGSGKTMFARGLALGLGVADEGLVRSPSFTLVNFYPGRLPIYHVDLYRIETLRDLETIGLEEIFAEKAVVVVEWAEKLPHEPETGWKVVIKDLGDTRRQIEFSRI
ncbi:MAG: tRNA (adenosine(37)-N6)-threonylcarbamoyltransferase complex ATPase subunit type 1 TsaE [Acidobacteria bacterium]|nr:tRNA (adenosine(37)-N6)-threonylcarbamoyltransferase complex ATPase subunit type 1 TsaE [Acidobacteriota bacterium]